MSDSMHLETDSDPETQAEHMVNQLGGSKSALSAARRYQSTAKTAQRRAYWSAVAQWIGHGESA